MSTVRHELFLHEEIYITSFASCYNSALLVMQHLQGEAQLS
jgi:hypothetical protein